MTSIYSVGTLGRWLVDGLEEQNHPKPRLRWIKWIHWISCWLGMMSVGLAQVPEVTTFKQLERLPLLEAAKGLPTKFTGVVLCYDRDWGQLYIHDGAQTRYFSPQNFTNQLEPGQWVEISGKTTVIEGSAGVTNLNLNLLGRRDIPAAKRLELTQLASDFGQWIETRGRVRTAENSRGRLGMTIHSSGQDCLVYVLGPSANYDFKRLLDCEVLIRGINASKVVKGRLEAAWVFAPSLREVQTLDTQPQDLSKLPVVSIDALLNRKLGDWTNRLVHLNGLVTVTKPGEFIVVRDPTGVIRAEAAQITRVQPDERVDIWGFLTAGPTEAVLKYAFFEVVHPPGSTTSAPPPDVPFATPTRETEVLIQVSNIMSLPKDRLAQHLPVRLKGIITFADPEFHNGFFQDGTDAIYLDLTQADVRAGQWVELTGQTDPGGFAPQINNVVVRILGTTNMPVPMKVDLDDLAEGQWDSHWLELNGVVRRAEVEWGHLYLSLTTRKGRFKTIIPGFDNQPIPSGLIDAMVSVPGACTSEVNARGQLSGITLHTPSLDYIRTIDPVPTNPFAAPTRPIAMVSTFDPNRRAGHRVKVAGSVTLVQPRTGFFLQDDSGGIRVSTLQTNTLKSGDRIEVLGFATMGDFAPYLEEVSFRTISEGDVPKSKKTTAEEILLRGNCDGQLVELKARLMQAIPPSAQPKLVLQDGPIIFTAHLVSHDPHPMLQELESGSILRLNGVCVVQGGEQHEPEAFRLLLSHPKDVQLLNAPAWWTIRRAAMAVSGLLVVIAISLAWVVSLRSRVRSQTEVIRQKLEERNQFEAVLRENERKLRLIAENTTDVIFAFDMEQRLLYVNSAVKELTGFAFDEIQHRDFNNRIHEDDQDRMRRHWEELYTGKGYSEVEFRLVTKSGEVKWCSSTWGPIFDENGRQIGVQGRERDISERKRLESELLEISAKERRRLGHELHDGLGQYLAGIALKAKLLEENLASEKSDQILRAKEVVGLINAAIRQSRNLAHGLDPVHVEADGLVAALGNLVAQTKELFHLDCTFACQQNRLEANLETSLALYRITQEAIHNAVVHGQARRIEVQLTLQDAHLCLTVRDYGNGFSPGAEPTSGMGLRIMRYRAGSISGNLTIDSTPHWGTRIVCRVPQSPRPAKEQNSAAR